MRCYNVHETEYSTCTRVGTRPLLIVVWGTTMSKRETYEEKAAALLAPIIDRNGFELVDVEYVKEGSQWYLRGYIDKPGGITINDCEAVSREFSDLLDRDDFIPDSYILEISSPGLDRPLKKPRDFERNLGKEVEIRTYKPIDRKKEFVGELVSFSDHSVVIRMDGEEKTFEKTDIALVRLYIEF